MQTLNDITTEITARAMVANNSIQFSPTRITQVAQMAYLWAGTLHYWPPLYRARVFSTKPNIQSLNYDYYDYPVDALTDSSSRLYIAGKKYDKKDYQAFLDYVDGSIDANLQPDKTKRYFSEYGRQFFIWPGATIAGVNDGLIWVAIQPLQIVNPTDLTIFSLWNDAGNEATVQYGLGILFERLDSAFAMQQKQFAINTLEGIWDKIMQARQRATQVNHPLFSVFDMYGAQSGMSSLGSFNSVVDVVA